MWIEAGFFSLLLVLVCFQLFSWIRLGWVLGGLNFRVRTTSSRWGLISSSINTALMLGVFYSSTSRSGSGVIDRAHMMISITGIVIGVLGIIFSFLDGQIREEGIYAGGRMYTWDKILSFRIEEGKIILRTAKKTWRGKNKEITWDLVDGAHAQVLSWLEHYGVGRATLQSKGGAV